MTPFSRQRLTVTMVPTLFKRLYQALFLAAVGTSIVAFCYGWIPTIASVEALSHRSPVLCVFHWLTSWDCPGCGLTRAVIGFFSGSLSLSFYFHPLGPLVGFLFCYLFLLSFRKNFQIRIENWIPKKWSVSVLLVVVAWGVLRNL
jgi:Protein of unknown function (DUF2752)